MAFTYVTITRDYDLADGVDPVGEVVFTPTAPMTNGPTVVAAPVTRVLDIDGILSISLAANTDPATIPADTSYLVKELIAGVSRSYYVQIPHDSGSTIDLSTLVPATIPPVVAYPAMGPAGPQGATGPAGSSYTDEQAQDAAAAMVAAGTHTGITFTYDDVANALSATTDTSYYLAVDATGTTDAAPSIAAAITALGSGGGIINLPPGTISVASRSSIAGPNIVLAGAGREQTVLVAASGIGANEVVRLTSAATGSCVRDLTITAATSTNHSALRLAAPNSRAERVTVVGGAGGALRGIAVDSTATAAEVVRCRVSGIRTAAATFGAGVGISVAADDTVLDQCVTTDCTGTTTAGYYQQMGGIFASGVSGSSGRRIRVLNCRSYSNGVHGLYASGNDNLTIDGGSYYSNGALATASGGVGGSAFGRGISIGTAAAVGVKIVNTYLFNNDENGLIISGGASGTGSSDGSLIRDTIIANNHAYDNNLGGFAGGHGIEVNSFGGVISGNVCYRNHNGIAVTGVRQTITGNRCWGNTSSDNTQGNGIQLYFQGVTPPTVSATTTNGSTQVTVASGGFPDVFEDQTISGTGIAGGSVVISISGNTLTMNTAATASGTNTLTFTAVNSNNQVVGNFCSHNDNNGIRAFGTVNHQNVIISNNSLLYNGLAERSGVNYDLLVSSVCRFGTYIGNATRSTSSRISISDPFPNRVGNITASDNGMVRSLTYGTSITWAGENAEIATLIVTNSTAFTMGSPSAFYGGRKATYRITNSSGGAMGAITWGTGQFALAGAFTNPANGNTRVITFQYDGSRWMEISRSAADIT